MKWPFCLLATSGSLELNPELSDFLGNSILNNNKGEHLSKQSLFHSVQEQEAEERESWLWASLATISWNVFGEGIKIVSRNKWLEISWGLLLLPVLVSQSLSCTFQRFLSAGKPRRAKRRARTRNRRFKAMATRTRCSHWPGTNTQSKIALAVTRLGYLTKFPSSMSSCNRLSSCMGSHFRAILTFSSTLGNFLQLWQLLKVMHLNLFIAYLS